MDIFYLIAVIVIFSLLVKLISLYPLYGIEVFSFIIPISALCYYKFLAMPIYLWFLLPLCLAAIIRKESIFDKIDIYIYAIIALLLITSTLSMAPLNSTIQTMKLLSFCLLIICLPKFIKNEDSACKIILILQAGIALTTIFLLAKLLFLFWSDNNVPLSFYEGEIYKKNLLNMSSRLYALIQVINSIHIYGVQQEFDEISPILAIGILLAFPFILSENRQRQKAYSFTLSLFFTAIFFILGKHIYIFSFFIGLIIQIFLYADSKIRKSITAFLLISLLLYILVTEGKNQVSFIYPNLLYHTYKGEMINTAIKIQDIWKVFKTFQNNQLLGIGLGNAKNLNYSAPEYIPHIFIVLAEIGIVGILAHLLFISYSIQLALHSIKRSKDKTKQIIISCFSCLIVLYISIFTNIKSNILIATFILGIIVSFKIDNKTKIANEDIIEI